MYLSMDEMEERGIYRIKSRNLTVGVWDGKTGFIGIREKFGDRFLFTEYHWDTGAPHGTAKPLEKIGELPEGIIPVSSFGTWCNDCDRKVDWDFENIRWIYTETGETMDESCEPVRRHNSDLFDYLEPLNKEEIRKGWEE